MGSGGVYPRPTRAGTTTLAGLREVVMGNRWSLITAGLFLSAFWFGCEATTVVPGSPAVTGKWAICNVLAFFAGGAFGAAACVRRGV